MSHHPNVILYVADVAASKAFYADVLSLSVHMDTPGFAMLAFSSGLELGLWQRDTVVPAVSGTPGAQEIAVPLRDADTLHTRYDALKAGGVPIAQEIEQLGFGLAFTITDPDGHRIRHFVPRGLQ